jgi:hypothetical protein
MNSSQVDCQVVALCNWFVTQCKTERLSAGVNSLIPVPIIRFVSLSKWLATHCSTVWLFHSHIQFNKEALCKQFVTTCATIRLQYENIAGGKPAGIYVQKICHTLRNYMVFSPVWTLICWSTMLLHANDLPHNVQLKGFSPAWALYMQIKTVAPGKQFAAQCATVLLFNCVNFSMLIKFVALFIGFATQCALCNCMAFNLYKLSYVN